MNSILSDLKRIFNRKVSKEIKNKYIIIVYPHKNNEYRKIVYQGHKNKMIKAFFKYDYNNERWYIID